MSITNELSNSLDRFKVYIDRLIALVQKHNIDSIPKLIEAFRHNDSFSSDWKAIWVEIADADGGKITLTTVGAIIGAVLGGVGIAAMGGAIGLPLAFVLGLGGLVAGAEFDSMRQLSQTKFLLLRLPKPLYTRIADAARSAEISENELIVRVLAANLPDPSEFDAPNS
jgi:hypothetical protein